jgi:L-amino acid N-acyltransferase YncA
MMIRDAVEADLPAIVDIYNAAIAMGGITADLEPVTLESRLSWFRLYQPQRPLWVVEIDGAIAGWLGFQSFYSSRAAYHATAELSIYIAPDYHRMGLGRKLLQTAIARSPELGLKTLVGAIFAINQPSLQLFSQFGFTVWGHFPRIAEFNNHDCDLVIVGKRLDE